MVAAKAFFLSRSSLSKVSLSVSVMVNAMRFNSFTVRSLRFFVKYLRVMHIMRKWLIYRLYRENSLNRFCISSNTMPLMTYPRSSIETMAVK